MSAWIKMISDENASKKLTKTLNFVKTPHGTVDNVMRVHSLRPSTMRGHYTLYKSVLHDSDNSLPTWFQEIISSYVSILNYCEYSFDNHWANAKYLIDDDKKSSAIKFALKTDKLLKIDKCGNTSVGRISSSCSISSSSLPSSRMGCSDVPDCLPPAS